MAYKDMQRRSHPLQHCSSLCRALPPIVFACTAFWFFCFLVSHSISGTSKKATLVHVDLDTNTSLAQGKEQPIKPVPTIGNSLQRGSSSSASYSGSYSPSMQQSTRTKKQQEGQVQEDCDLSAGRWVRDEKNSRRKVYDGSCRDIFKGWNCLGNNKSNSLVLIAWQWQPWKCDLPQLNASLFLKRFKHKSIGFVGDSLNRNMYAALVCSLKQAAQQVRKWRPRGADKAVTFLDYNLTLAYHRTNLLARYGRWEAKVDGGYLESLGYREGYRVDVDIPQSTWAEAPHLHDVLIFNTGHWWWAPDKFDPVKSPMLFFQQGEPIIPFKSPEDGLDLVLKNMLNYVDKEMPASGLKVFRTQSPRHFEGGEWNQGGTCHRTNPLTSHEVEALFANGTNVEMRLANQHLERALKGTTFKLLNISYLSSFRADAHPSKSGGKLHEDCMHWCLPGVTDVWNDMLVMLLLRNSQETYRT